MTNDLYLGRNGHRTAAAKFVRNLSKLCKKSKSKKKQAGTGPSRRHIQGSKIAKRLPSVNYSLLQFSKKRLFYEKKISKKLHTQKMDRVARRGPLARAPGALKGGHFRICLHFCRS